MTTDRISSRGFTLVELLIVVVILGILAAVVIPTFAGAAAEAKESALRADLNTVRQAVSLYRVQHDEVYPGQGGWSEFVTQLTTGTAADGTPGSQFGPYLRTAFPMNQVANPPNANGKTVATMPGSPSGPEGWVYCTTTGELRANTAGTAPSGEAYFNL